jgi:hypothetical protein
MSGWRDYHKRDYHRQPEYQVLGEKRLLCLLCARVVGTSGKRMHEKGVEHRSALAEMGRRAS